MFIADFHIHSKYSRATSKECVAEVLDFWARRKGIQVIGTGDFTHPAWREELKEKLIPAGEGLYALKADFRREGKVAGTAFTPQFIVSGEISSIYKKNGRVRKVHNLILLPGLEQAEFISRKLEAVGNLRSDGRPILGLDSRDLLEIVLECCPEAMFIPAHIWTPHFSLYGAYSGFDAIEECFEDLTGYIYALETGLSSDPAMNWRISALDKFTLVSNSDAHSPANLAREANIFNTGLSYSGMLQALKNRSTTEFYGTLEFFPEEGKYHYDGHRVCKVCWKPEMTRAAGGLCPVCGGQLTVGVLHRVEALADREEGFIPPAAKPFESIVPLVEIIASSIGATAASRRVRQKYEQLLQILGPELFILREAQLADIELAAGSCITEGIRRLRCGKVAIQPGFDGEYGKVKVLDKSEIELFSGQLCFLRDELVSDSGTAGKEPSGPAAVTGAAVQAAKQVRETDGDAGLAEGSEKAPQAVPASLPYGLNKEQWEAVSASAPAIAVVAGPGTGKTKTLVCRIAYLIEQRGIHPSQITAVTFTNKAAQEMRSRLEGHFGNKRTAGAMAIGTFHSICLQRLSQWRGKETITIIDEQQARSMIGEIVKSMKLELSLRDALKAIWLIKNGAPPAGDESNAVSTALLYDAYCSQLKRYGVMDYDDILLEVLQRLEGGPAGALSDRSGSGEKCCSYLLVDEFQDINEIQYRLIKQWGRNCESIFIIGDPDQSIYGFRGSDFRYFAKFTEEFPGSRKVRLTQNYRSTPEIIAAAQAVIAKKAAGDETRLLNPTRESGVKVRLIESKDEFAEAIFVAKEINRMVGGIDMLDAQIRAHKARPAGQSRGFADIAILYRTNRQAEVLEQCLLKEGIPYSVAGRDDFLSDKPVREAMAFFKFLLNPGDILSLLECFKAKSIAAAELSLKIIERYAAGRKSITALEKLLTELPSPINQPGVFPAFIEMLGRYKPVIRKERPAGIIDSWISDNNLSGIKSMELLLHTAVTHQDMSSFIQNFVLGRESDIVRSSGKVYSTDAVSLMTVHAAKGLEFPVTFICGVNDGLMPLKNSVLNFDFAEERRLFYVGVTRARDELVLMTFRTLSPFIAELPGGLLMVENAGKQRPAPRYKQDSLFDSLPALR